MVIMTYYNCKIQYIYIYIEYDNMVGLPNLVTHLNQTPIFEWDMV